MDRLINKILFFVGLAIFANPAKSFYSQDTARLLKLETLLKDTWIESVYQNTYFVNGTKTETEEVTLLYRRTINTIILFAECKVKEKVILYRLINGVLTIGSNYLDSSSIKMTNSLWFLEQRIPMEVFPNYPYEIDKNKIRVHKKNDEYYNSKYLFNKKNDLVKIITIEPNYSKTVYSQIKSEFCFSFLDSNKFTCKMDSLNAALKLLFHENNKVNMNNIDLDFIDGLQLINVKTNKEFKLDQKKIRILDFSFLACGPCWINFRIIESILHKNSNAIFTVIDPNYNPKRDLKYVEEKINLPNYCRVLNTSYVNERISAYPFLVIINSSDEIVYLHTGLINESDYLEILEILNKER